MMEKGKATLEFHVDNPDDKTEVVAALAGSDLKYLIQEHRKKLKQMSETAESEQLSEIFTRLVVELDDHAWSLGVSDLINPC